MPLTAFGWTAEEEAKLVQLVQPHSILHKVQDPSRRNIIARESTWTEIAAALSKPVEDCKKRWRGLRDSYVRSKRCGQLHPSRVQMFESLQFLDEGGSDEDGAMETNDDTNDVPTVIESEQVITDNDNDNEYFEITVMENSGQSLLKMMKAEPPPGQVIKKKRGTNGGRRKALPIIRNATPVKILPKPIIVNSSLNNGPSLPKLVKYVDEPAPRPTSTSTSQTIDKLIERILKENTNEIDVFFRSMAASVKKLQPSLIPKVKMEVCNVIAKYEMQNF